MAMMTTTDTDTERPTVKLLLLIDSSILHISLKKPQMGVAGGTE